MAEEIKIKELVGESNRAYFDSYRAGFFYYNVKRNHSTHYYQFQIPVTDLGNATLLNEEKAITLMRWIRKSITDGTLTKIP